MCGIFGLVAKSSSANNMETYLSQLLLLSEPRGRQATGLAIKTDKTISLFKRPQGASELIKSVEYKRYIKEQFSTSSDHVAALGHCRLVTDGSELIHQNNQPIVMENAVGVHNGVINNFESISDKHNFNSGNFSDSNVLFEYISNKIEIGLTPMQAISSFQKEMRGSMSIGIISSQYNELIVTTNFGSLYYAKPSDDLYFFASEEKIVNAFLRQNNLKGKACKLEAGSAQIIDLNDLKTKSLSHDEPQQPSNKTNTKITFKDCTPRPLNLRRCKRCILPENYPFIEFDKDGVCSICQKYKRQKCHGKEALEKLLSNYRSKDGSVDCVIGLSGGRDSSYGLHVLKEEFGMNPVGFSYDWLLTSRKARHNIAKMSGALGVEVIYRCGDYETQARNIRDNIYGFLKEPDLGMMTFVQAGDKEMYHYGRKIRKEKNQKLTVWCSGYQLEQREFFLGYCGINKTLINNPRLYDYGWYTKVHMAIYYGFKTIKNPWYWNKSIWHNFLAFWHCFIARDDFLYLYNYYPWHELEVERVLREKYEWEADLSYGANQWRMDDFHTAFINYVYYTVGGFSEFDDFRSNQVREGLISREEALRLAAIDNNIRYESLLEFSSLVGFNLEHVLRRIDAIPKLYRL